MFNYVRHAKEYGHDLSGEEQAPISQQTLNLQLLKIHSIISYMGGRGRDAERGHLIAANEGWRYRRCWAGPAGAEDAEAGRDDRAQPSGSCSPRARRHLGASSSQPPGALPGGHFGLGGRSPLRQGKGGAAGG